MLCLGAAHVNIHASQPEISKTPTQQTSRVGVLDCFQGFLQKVKNAEQQDSTQSTKETRNALMTAQLELLCAFDLVISNSKITDQQKEACALLL